MRRPATTPAGLRRQLRRQLRRITGSATLPIAVALAASLSATLALAAPPRDRLTLLVPDKSAATLASWQVKVWLDAAADEGVRMELLSDAELLAQCTPTPNCAAAAARYAGLILPDSAHIRASDAVVAAVKSYTNLGGRVMVVYDAAALDDRGFYSLNDSSRLSDLVGVDYVKYDSLRDRVVGFGPVVGSKSRLESLGFPPGKYGTYAPPASLSNPTNATAFVPTGVTDPGGSMAMAPAIAQRAAKGADDGSSNLRARRAVSLRELLGLNTEPMGPVRYSQRILAAGLLGSRVDTGVKRLPEHVSAAISADLKSTTELALPPVTADDQLPQTITGYGFGALNYFHFVTLPLDPVLGYGGTTYLSSPEHGLVAGLRRAGSGQVLFVNMPLGYLKALGTDSAPMQGFLGHFARDVVGVTTTSVQPRAVGGMIYNWHVDDVSDLESDSAYLLNFTSLLKRGPFSIHFTAGPDTINYGDRTGMNVGNIFNLGGRDLVRRMSGAGLWDLLNLQVDHGLGSHGGWIHDCWGDQADKVQTIAQAEGYLPFCGTPGTPSLTLTGMLKKNFDAIEGIVGYKLREYSSPVGNTPTWAVNWLEANKPDVVAMYLVGDVGSAMLRSWRATLDSTATNPNAARLSTRIWSSPVTPYGKYATWEEFSDFGITRPASAQWLVDLQSFVVNRRTNRMFYNHPPGARANKDPIDAVLDRSDRLQQAGRFKFYTMADLAAFSQRRIDSSWVCTSCGSGTATFQATHPSTLKDISWMLPKASYGQPAVVSGRGTVSSDSTTWIVTADSGTAISFRATELAIAP